MNGVRRIDFSQEAIDLRTRLIIIVIIAILILSIYGLYLLNRRSAADDLLNYPNAEAVHISEFRAVDGGQALERVITFETNDTPEAVSTHYKAFFERAGWSTDYAGGRQWPSPSYGDRSANEGQATYTVGITIDASPEGKTQVTLNIWKLQGWWE